MPADWYTIHQNKYVNFILLQADLNIYCFIENLQKVPKYGYKEFMLSTEMKI